jgi:hypothetical protein
MRHSLPLLVTLLFLLSASVFAQTSRTPAKDRQTLIETEEQWLHSRDAATLNHILASEFVHVIPATFWTSRRILIGS